MKSRQRTSEDHNGYGGGNMYLRYAGMIGTASVLMYLFTYWNTFAWDHLFFSEERVYMTLTMTAMMAVVMLSFMRTMLSNRGANLGIYIGSALLFALALILLRSQAAIEDTAYMKSMIPHHSIAILTSDRARLSDRRVRKLADEIRSSQREEIDEMKRLLADIEAHGVQEMGAGQGSKSEKGGNVPILWLTVPGRGDEPEASSLFCR